MSDKPENPPAFPGPVDHWMSDSPHGAQWASSYGLGPNQGMTLRDYFAGQAVVGIVMQSNFLNQFATRIGQEGSKYIAMDAYGIADAMLAERNK